MPEIVEVRTYAAFISKNLCGKRLTKTKILGGRYKTHGPPDAWKKLTKALPLTVSSVSTKGKFMIISLENEFFLGITLGLSGGC
jgi:formamidopyrimidine-DNA glycosylase